jgi:hypothetical protein
MRRERPASERQVADLEVRSSQARAEMKARESATREYRSNGDSEFAKMLNAIPGLTLCTR